MERENTAETIVGLMIDCADIKTEENEDRREDPLENRVRSEAPNEMEENGLTQDNERCVIIESADLKVEMNEETGNDPLEDETVKIEDIKMEDSNVLEIEEKGFSLDNEGCTIIESADFKVESNEEPGIDSLEDGDGGNELENETCHVKMEDIVKEDSEEYVFKGRGQLTWMNEAQVLDFEKNSGQVLESERDSSGLYPCIDCGIKFKTNFGIVNHHKLQKCKFSQIVCKECGERFSHKDFKQHLVLCAPEQLYNCTKCSENFTRWISLYKHYESHTGNETSPSGNSQTNSSSESTIGSEHVSPSGRKRKRENDFKVSEGELTEKADYILNDQQNEKDGQGIHKGINIFKTNETENKCQKNELSKMSSSHPRESSGCLPSNEEIVTSPPESSSGPYHCIDCGIDFKQNKSFVNHRKRQKCNFYQIVCGQCGETFSRKDFEPHSVLCATEQQYKCKKCFENFTSWLSLVKHYESHTGNKMCIVGQVLHSGNSQTNSSSEQKLGSEHVSHSSSAKTIGSGKHVSHSSSANTIRSGKHVSHSSSANTIRSGKHVSHSSSEKKIRSGEHVSHSSSEKKIRSGEHMSHSSSASTIGSGEHVSLSGSGLSDGQGNDSQSNFKCQECDQMFSHLALLQSHSLEAHPYKFKTGGQFNCKKCDLAFISQAVYIEHLMTHSKAVEMTQLQVRKRLKIMNDQSESSDEGFKYGCQICHCWFREMSVLLSHQGHCKYKLKCQQCGKRFKNTEDLYKHSLTHLKKPQCDQQTNKYQCWMCSEVFCRKTLLEKHTYLAGCKRSKCSVCNKVLWSKCSLSQHMNTHKTTLTTK